MSNQLTKLAKELLLINEDIDFRIQQRGKHNVADFELVMFDQVWGSTALGFGGIGGQAMTDAKTYVFIPQVDGERCIVYFAGRFAYSVPYSAKFMEDVSQHCLAPVYLKNKYIEELNEYGVPNKINYEN